MIIQFDRDDHQDRLISKSLQGFAGQDWETGSALISLTSLCTPPTGFSRASVHQLPHAVDDLIGDEKSNPLPYSFAFLAYMLFALSKSHH